MVATAEVGVGKPREGEGMNLRGMGWWFERVRGGEFGVWKGQVARSRRRYGSHNR